MNNKIRRMLFLLLQNNFIYCWKCTAFQTLQITTKIWIRCSFLNSFYKMHATPLCVPLQLLLRFHQELKNTNIQDEFQIFPFSVSYVSVTANLRIRLFGYIISAPKISKTTIYGSSTCLPSLCKNWHVAIRMMATFDFFRCTQRWQQCH